VVAKVRGKFAGDWILEGKERMATEQEARLARWNNRVIYERLMWRDVVQLPAGCRTLCYANGTRVCRRQACQRRRPRW